MKYADYKKLTAEQKEEWNFRFKDHKPLFSLTEFVMFKSVISVLIFVIYISITDTRMAIYQSKIMEIFNSISVIILLAFIYIFAAVIDLVINMYGMYSFRKKCGLLRS